MRGYLKLAFKDFYAWQDKMTKKANLEGLSVTKYTYFHYDINPLYIWVRVENDFAGSDFKIEQEAVALGMQKNKTNIIIKDDLQMPLIITSDSFGVENNSPIITYNTLTVTVGSFSVLDTYGAAYNFSEQSIAIPADSTKYIVMDLCDGTIHSFPRAIGDGIIPICIVTTDNTSITSITRLPLEIPKTSVYNITQKLSNCLATGDVRIAAIGDSLTSGAGDTPYWYSLNFDTAQSASGLNVTNAGKVSFTNYGVGSATAEMGLMWTAESVLCNGGDYTDRGLHWGVDEAARRYSPPNTACRKSPFISSPYDLVLIGFGANALASTLDMGILESTIYQLRKAGSEVAVITEHRSSSVSTYLQSNSLVIKEMCDALGAAYIDTWSYVYESFEKGEDTFYDSIHLGVDGQKAWARAIKAIIDPVIKLKSTVRKPVSRVVRSLGTGSGNPESNVNQWRTFPNAAHIVFSPNETTGTAATTTTVTDAVKNPAINWGGKTSSNAITSLAAGQRADFSHGWFTGMALIIDGSSAFTATIYNQNGGNTISTVSFSNTVSGRLFVLEGIKIGGLGTSMPNLNRFNSGIQIVCDTGTLKLIGVMFHTDDMQEMDFVTTPNYTGTWATEAGLMGAPLIKYSDTNGDSFNFTFDGSMAVVYVGKTTKGGIVDVYRNGELIISQLDLYNGSDQIYAIVIPNGNTTNYVNKIPSHNAVQIKLNGANGSAGTPSSGARRLGVYGIKVINKA